ncbi:MAG: hypothetical protein A2Y62_02635 [Candidatus Fischerbacteria bacterium RBG_13_37_8]|uniref:Uncharacterized protein n=1 Tax=Candidatus Fischerbacteria bacterium RBG_13_37_8 TaxID=1817863 RepID=A0A1F5VS17_9BACT|nr:MAG: hypothetical protein A2Y62_02635 [Candidatus Fischerbacteria bacterium RBG_13_37_8]
MRSLFTLLILLAIAVDVFPCSPKQEWIPVIFITGRAEAEFIGQAGNNNKYKISVQGKFHPGTHGLVLRCSNDYCCDLYDKTAKYRISYCLDQPCGCVSTVTVPSKCFDIPMASFCDPLNGISCAGPYFHSFEQFKGNVAEAGKKGGCPNNNTNNCQENEIPILEFEGTFIYQRAIDATYPYTLNITVCLTEGIKQTGACKKISAIISYGCPDPCCPPECPVNCPVSPQSVCEGDDDGGGDPCNGTLRISSNGWITFRVLKQGDEVIPWTHLSNVDTNPALTPNGPLNFELACGNYDIEYDEADQKEEGDEVCWSPSRYVTIKRDRIKDVVANKREWHHHVKFPDGHYEPHSPDECPYKNTTCNK